MDSWLACHEFEHEPLKTHHVEKLMNVPSVGAQTSSRWCGVEVKRVGCQLKGRPRHLTMVQNDEIRRQKPSCS
ncbi:hypothetical protein TNCV_2219631 [Trichonephila clavipes]|nr:hypothetical protein TNCV_2219631 [Trichonephila clavipes]